MPLLTSIALKHLLARKRQSVVSLMGIVLGVAFFLAISSLMQGSEKDFITRLVDNSPHITISDEYRNPSLQPAQQLYPKGAVEIRHVQPVTETRGIRDYGKILAYLTTIPGLVASPSLGGAALINYAGKDTSVSLNGMIPEEIRKVSTIENYMVEGSIDNLVANPNGVVIGYELARRLTLRLNDNISITATTGQTRTFKIVGIFRTGRSSYDTGQVFMALKRVQALLDRSNRINGIIIKLPEPKLARQIAADIESRIGYKAVSWQEVSEDLMSTIAIRNAIMYTVVSAVLIVAAFGIYNVISTVVMEKRRDIAILKSMGFHATDIQHIFLIQGVILGALGCLFGLPLGCGFMLGLMQVKMKIPGSSGLVPMPLSWDWPQFAIAASFALSAAIAAALLPARKAAHVQPVDILRGS